MLQRLQAGHSLCGCLADNYLISTSTCTEHCFTAIADIMDHFYVLVVCLRLAPDVEDNGEQYNDGKRDQLCQFIGKAGHFHIGDCGICWEENKPASNGSIGKGK